MDGLDRKYHFGIVAGMRLADFLADREMSQAEFAKRIGATQASVSRYADGSRMPRREHLARIRKVTGGAVRADDFLLLHDTWPQKTRRAS
jgi:transcriptional regulator with XRE-family HTH domain